MTFPVKYMSTYFGVYNTMTDSCDFLCATNAGAKALADKMNEVEGYFTQRFYDSLTKEQREEVGDH